MEKLKLYELAPSGYLDRKAFVRVASALLHTGIRDKPHFNQYVFSNPCQQPEQPKEGSTSFDAAIGDFNKVMKLSGDVTLHITEKEASGIPLFGIFIMGIVRGLRQQIHDFILWCDMEFVVYENKKRGTNPSTDTAVVAITTSSAMKTIEHPVILYEYKPVVGRDYLSVDPKDLMEVMIQAFYTMSVRNINHLLHCLTDMTVWHYFKMERSQKHIQVIWHHTILDNWQSMQAMPDIKTHILFLLPVVKEQLALCGLKSS